MGRNGGNFEPTRYGGYGRNTQNRGHFHKYDPSKKTGNLLESWTDRISKSDDDRRGRAQGRTKQQDRDRSRSREKTPDVSFIFKIFENYERQGGLSTEESFPGMMKSGKELLWNNVIGLTCLEWCARSKLSTLDDNKITFV